MIISLNHRFILCAETRASTQAVHQALPAHPEFFYWSVDEVLRLEGLYKERLTPARPRSFTPYPHAVMQVRGSPMVLNKRHSI